MKWSINKKSFTLKSIDYNPTQLREKMTILVTKESQGYTFFITNHIYNHIYRNEGSNDCDNMKDQANLKVVDKAEKSSKKSSRSSSIDEIFNEEIKVSNI